MNIYLYMGFKAFNEQTTRYSVEMNYRTSMPEMVDGYAKLLLGYLSAALKSHGYHIKMVLDSKPMRITISTKNWDDGERSVVVSFQESLHKFIISKGFYNKGSRTVALEPGHKTLQGTSAAELMKEIIPFIHSTEKEPVRPPQLRPIKMKTGPKPFKKR